MSEYYIKQPNTDHARGPLNLEQLASLADTGSVNEDTLLYDEVLDKWKPLSGYPELLPLVFPEKRTLSLNKKEANPTEEQVTNAIAEGREKPEISAETILAAAAGETHETRHIGSSKRSREKAAELAVPGIGSLLIIFAFALVYPGKNQILSAVENGQWYMGLGHPLVILGLVNLALGVAVFIGVTSVFPLVRVSAAVGCGLMGYLFWSWENPILMTLSIVLNLGLFGATIASRYFWMLISLAAGIMGATTLAYAGVAELLSY